MGVKKNEENVFMSFQVLASLLSVADTAANDAASVRGSFFFFFVAPECGACSSRPVGAL